MTIKHAQVKNIDFINTVAYVPKCSLFCFSFSGSKIKTVCPYLGNEINPNESVIDKFELKINCKK